MEAELAEQQLQMGAAAFETVGAETKIERVVSEANSGGEAVSFGTPLAHSRIAAERVEMDHGQRVSVGQIVSWRAQAQHGGTLRVHAKLLSIRGPLIDFESVVVAEGTVVAKGRV